MAQSWDCRTRGVRTRLAICLHTQRKPVSYAGPAHGVAGLPSVVEQALRVISRPAAMPDDDSADRSAPVTPKPAAAADVAHRLWARFARESHTPGEAAAAAEDVHAQLRAGLGRWVGAEGYRALLTRALTLAEEGHPVVGGLSFLGGDESAIDPAGREHGPADVAAGMEALIAALIEVLGRIVGQEMAVRLVEQVGLPSSRGVASSDT